MLNTQDRSGDQQRNVGGLGRICAALEIEFEYNEKNKANHANRLRNKRLRRGDR